MQNIRHVEALIRDFTVVNETHIFRKSSFTNGRQIMSEYSEQYTC